jgi:hypothetical protein
MARRVFISYQHKDRMRAKGFNLLRWNKNVDLEFVGKHLLDPVDSNNESYISTKVQEQLKGTSVTVVLLGKETAQSTWVQWEIEQSLEKKNGILAIKLSDDVPNPGNESPVGKALIDAGAEILDWKPDQFDGAIERAFKAAGRVQAAAAAASTGSDTDCGR